MTLKVDSDRGQVGLQGKIDTGSSRVCMQSVMNLLRGLVGGQEAAVVNVMLGVGDGTAASGTLTISANTAQSVTINGKLLTGGTDYVIATLTASQIGDNIVAAVNSSTNSRLQAVIASNNAGVVTISARDPGAIGNVYTLAATGAAASSGANLSGGVDATQHSFNMNKV